MISQDGNEGTNVPALARTLLAVVGSCNQLPDVQNILIVELKGSLTRALIMQESKLKHSRLQALFNLIVTIIESTAPQTLSAMGNVPNMGFVRMLIRKGLITDLAKTPHSLDLSSPYLVTTVNCMLKPLEKLSSLASNQTVTGKGETKEDGKTATENRTATDQPGQQTVSG